MKKNILKKFVIFSLIFVLLLTHNVFAEELIPEVPSEETPEIVPEEIVEPERVIPTENVFIRNNDNIVYDSTIDLPESGVVNVLDSNGNNHEVNSQSVLGLLYTLSQKTEASFTISNLQYYSSMNAFYLKCITPKGGIELCDNWQYVVGGTTPWTGIDQTFLTGGEQVGLYFGAPHKLTLDKSDILEGESVKVNSFKYNYIDNTWEILPSVSISVTIPNPLDTWNPTIISETKVDENGMADIAINSEGTYTFGIKEDYSFPAYQVVVSKKPDTSGSGGNDNNIVVPNFSIENAVNFLSTNQINDNFYTDWTAIGVAKVGDKANNLINKISNYFKNETLGSLIVTDNERHAMALMALGINPYNGTSVDYIKKITLTFDGTQIGDSSLYNDDIFGLIVLSHAGYTKNDEIIPFEVSYIISKQGSDGSWGSIDMTGAAIQALSNFKSLSGAAESISKGESYLKNIQNTDGGFGNPSSTSWAVQALSQNTSFKNEVDKAVLNLSTRQKIDGGLDDGDINNRVWSTSYALPAILKLSWNDILDSFEKEEVAVANPTDEVKEELLPVLDLQVPEPIKKDNIEIVEKPIKIIDSKKEVKNKNKVKLSNNEERSGSVLSASAIGGVSNQEVPPSFINNILHIITRPFAWIWKLWVSLQL